jgi:hypothetical protein
VKGLEGTRARLGAACLGVGLVLVAAGLVVMIGDDDTTAAAPPRTTTTAAPAGSASAPAQTIARQTPEQFVATLEAALRSGDAEYLLARLHPAVIERYGTDACRTAMQNFSNDPTAAVRVRTVGSTPITFDYNQDGISTMIAGAIPVDVDLTTRGVTTSPRLHVAYVGDEPRWFSDCGTPLGQR